MNLSRRELQFYERQILLRQIGLAGQQCLKSKSILCVGSGGLGCPALTYLAAAGVGKIAIVDFDNVELSNLNRQVLFNQDDIGLKKASVAREKLCRLNPDIEITSVTERLTETNAIQLFGAVDLIIDGSDNFETKYLINDAALLCNKPFISASIFRFSGQLSVFNLNGGACYRCLFPRQPQDDLSPSCAEAGVFGFLPGIIGALQANEAVKVLLGLGQPLRNKLLCFDALAAQFDELEFDKNTECASCAQSSQIVLRTSERSQCLVNSNQQNEISPQELKNLLQNNKQVILVDVRSPAETELAAIEGFKNIPLDEIHKLSERGALLSRYGIDTAKQTICLYCKSGKRSRLAQSHLESIGVLSTLSLSGGIDGWLKATL